MANLPAVGYTQTNVNFVLWGVRTPFSVSVLSESLLSPKNCDVRTFLFLQINDIS